VCGLARVATRICGQLSKGFRQRVGIAQALIHNPPVLVLDEPTIGLDPRQIHEVRGLIRGLSGNRTIILSTHILPEVSQICDKVVIINEGRVVLEQALADLPAGTSLEELFLSSIAKEHHEEVLSEPEETLEEVGAGHT
jgi:ABC-2 type transport system ATP-binding protein